MPVPVWWSSPPPRAGWRHYGHRPAADPLFRSAALEGGPDVIGVILSGVLDDASRGCATIERGGGRVAVQDPEQSPFDGMPRAALAATRRAEDGTPDSLGRWIGETAGTGASSGPFRREPELEREISLLLDQGPVTAPAGKLHGFTCPDCDGPLFENDGGGRSPARFQCRVGHAWSGESMAHVQAEVVERAFWVALLRLEERLRLLERMTDRARRLGHTYRMARLDEQAREREALETMRVSRAGIGDTG